MFLTLRRIVSKEKVGGEFLPSQIELKNFLVLFHFSSLKVKNTINIFNILEQPTQIVWENFGVGLIF